MSSFYIKNEILQSRSDKLPSVIHDYNQGKGGVDLMDSCIADFSCKRKTNKYLDVFLFNMIDVALFNAFTIMKANGCEKSRNAFMKELSIQLAKEHMWHRYNNDRVYALKKNSFLSFGFPQKTAMATNMSCSSSLPPTKCQIQKCRRSTRTSCSQCSKRVCTGHASKFVLCENCHQ